MLIYLTPLLFILSSVALVQDRRTYERVTYPSAASTAQIKFAIENKYDDTGPAQNRPVYAYNTYKTLEDALVAYFEDPDTRLPENEKAKVVQNLLAKLAQPKPTNTLNTYKYSYYVEKPQVQAVSHKDLFMPKDPSEGPNDSKNAYPPAVEENTVLNTPADSNVKFQKNPGVKDNSLSLAHYTRDRDSPKYSFLYGVHDVHTGDIKRAAETRDGSTVRGYYTLLDSDGKQRVVQYTASDTEGFRASVTKLPAQTTLEG